MMELLLTVALPVFALVALGYAAGRWRVLSSAGIAGLNAFVAVFALPVMVFDKFSATPVGRVLDGPFIAAWLLADAIVFAAAGAALVYGFRRTLPQAAPQALSAAYGNTGFVGLPLAQAAAGRAAAIPMALCLTLDLVFLPPLALLLAGARERGGWRRAALPALGALFSNPLAIAILLGLGVSAVDVPMPAAVRAFTALLGTAAGPCALFATGALLAAAPAGSPDGALEDALAPLALVCAAKLVLHPLVTWGLMMGAFPVDSLWAAVAVLAAALPTAGTLASALGRPQAAAPTLGPVVLATTAASAVTLSIVLLLLFGTA